MKLFLSTVALAMALSTSAFAAAGHCDDDMKAVDTAITKAKLSDADMATVKAARAKAEELDKAGKEEDCEKALAPAQKLLGITDTHHKK